MNQTVDMLRTLHLTQEPDRADVQISGRYTLDVSGWYAGQRTRAYGMIEHGVWERRTGKQVLICQDADEAHRQAALMNSYAREAR